MADVCEHRWERLPIRSGVHSWYCTGCTATKVRPVIPTQAVVRDLYADTRG